jgi:hypothetical protein
MRGESTLARRCSHSANDPSGSIRVLHAHKNRSISDGAVKASLNVFVLRPSADEPVAVVETDDGPGRASPDILHDLTPAAFAPRTSSRWTPRRCGARATMCWCSPSLAGPPAGAPRCAAAGQGQRSASAATCRCAAPSGSRSSPPRVVLALRGLRRGVWLTSWPPARWCPSCAGRRCSKR